MSFDKPVAGQIDGSGHSYLVVAASYNADLVDTLLERTIAALMNAGVASGNIEVLRVPGSCEIPYATQLGIENRDYDCCIALGVIIRGDTIHYEIIAKSVTDALLMLSLNQSIPIVNGVIAAENREQAEARATGSLNRGEEFAATALHMAALRRQSGNA